jgi:type IV fimbrial biogenesis protein FimT
MILSPQKKDQSAPRGVVAGFTLLEALVVLSIVGVLLGLAVPSLTKLFAKHQLQAQAQGLLDSLLLARSEALRRQQPVTVCPGTTQGCDSEGAWSQGWLVFVDAKHNAQRDEGEALIETRESMPTKVQMGLNTTVKAYFSYGPEGRSRSTTGAFMAGTWRFCRMDLTEGWQVVSNALGKPRLEKYTLLQCP